MKVRQEVIESIGAYNFWGFTPSLHWDELDKYEKDKSYSFGKNILLVCVSDIRHIMRSLGEFPYFFKEKVKVYDYPDNEQINIYIYEHEAEILMRQMLQIVLTNADLNIRNKTELFLEIFGNCFVTERTEKIIDEYSQLLTRIITKDKTKSIHHLYEIFDMSLLKFKEIDTMEVALRQWRLDVKYNMEEFYEHRLRGLFKDRYDFRTNLCDWDYYAYVKDENKVNLIHWLHYKMYRTTGVSFETRMSEYKRPNRTLTSYAIGKVRNRDHENYGFKSQVKGYWGDVYLSPYYAYGITTADEIEMEEINKLYNERQKYNTLDVSDFNMRKYLTWMTHYKLIHFKQKEALTWKEKFEYDSEIQKLKDQRAEAERKKAEQERILGKKLDIINEEDEFSKVEYEKIYDASEDNERVENDRTRQQEELKKEKQDKLDETDTMPNLITEDNVSTNATEHTNDAKNISENEDIEKAVLDAKEKDLKDEKSKQDEIHPKEEDAEKNEDDGDLSYHYLKCDKKPAFKEYDESKPDKYYNEQYDLKIVKNLNLLRIFRDRNIKFHIMRSDKKEFRKTFDREKYEKKFDRIIFGSGCYQLLEGWEDWTKIMDSGAHVWFELIEYLHLVDMETKKEVRNKIYEKFKANPSLTEAEFNEILNKNGKHHLHYFKNYAI